MLISCPKCNTMNPQGAEICGECGLTLVSSSREHTPATRKPLSSEKKDLAGVLSEGGKKKAPIPVQILSGILWILGALLIVISVFLIKRSEFFTTLLLPVLPPELPYTLFSFPLMGAGIYTLIVVYGISNLKKWGVNVYISWVMVQVGVEVLARIYWHDLGVIYSSVVLAELCIVIILWRIKHRFVY